MLRFVRKDPWGKHTRFNWCESLVLAGFLIYFLFFLVHVSVCVFFPNDMDNEEGFILNQVHQLRTGHTIYPDLKDYPYTVGNYPPVFQLLCVPFCEIVGDIHFVGRAISILSTLLLGALIFLIIRQLSENLFGAIIGGLFPFAVHYVYRWAPYDRVDMLALFFALLGIFFLLNFPKRIGWAILLFTLALYTKQIMVAAPAAGFFYLLKENKKSAWIFLAGLLASCSVIFLFLNLVTLGQFYKHLVVYNVNPFHWGDVWNFYSNMLRFYWVFLFIVLVSILVMPKTSKIILLILYFLFSFLVSLSCGKEGSAVNYLNEMIIAGSIIMGIGIGWIRKNVYFSHILVPVLLLVQIGLIPHVPYTHYWYGFTPGERQFAVVHSVEDIVKETPGDMISDDASFLVRTGKPVLFQPFIMSTLARQGKWNPEKFINDIRKKRFSLLILYFPLKDMALRDTERYTPEILDAFTENYQFLERRDNYFVYNPRS